MADNISQHFHWLHIARYSKSWKIWTDNVVIIYAALLRGGHKVGHFSTTTFYERIIHVGKKTQAV